MIKPLSLALLSAAGLLLASDHVSADPAAGLPSDGQLLSNLRPPVAPITDADYPAPRPEQEELGRLLFFDKILSGNENISCASCHHPLAATSDGLSLPIGEGGAGLATSRENGLSNNAIHERVPRNAPALFGIGAKEYTVMFHDGRVAVDSSQPSGFFSPAGDDLPLGLQDVLAAQAMFPVTSGAEMAGQAGENSVADAAAAGNLAGENGVWAQLADRVRGIPEYVELFVEAFPEVQSAEDIRFVHIANALGAFEAAEYQVGDSPFDEFLRGDTGALSLNQMRGMSLFYGPAGCSDCHSGKFQTNHQFASIAAPQIGPGKGDFSAELDNLHDDHGRERVTGNPDDRYRFRVPALRNVALTGPWTHAGAYNSLEAVVRHHLNPKQALANYDNSQLILPDAAELNEFDLLMMDSPEYREILLAYCDVLDQDYSERTVDYLVDFLHALTEPRDTTNGRRGVPARVPSGLPVFD